MAEASILVTGATGTVGREVLLQLRQRGEPVRVAVRSRSGERSLADDGAEEVLFDFMQPATWPDTLSGIDQVFLVRPPAISDTKRHINPFIDAAERAGVRHVVLLSLLGAEKNPVVPHHRIETYLDASTMRCTFLRPSFFMQNLSTTHRQEIRERDEISVPAGRGRTSFIDARDIGEVGARALLEPGHENRAYSLTGSEALTYEEEATILSDVLGRDIAYKSPSLVSFMRRMRHQNGSTGFALVTAAIYTTARLGLAGTVTSDTEELLGRPPATFREFAGDYANCWQ